MLEISGVLVHHGVLLLMDIIVDFALKPATGRGG